jgi:hypothetical protein
MHYTGEKTVCHWKRPLIAKEGNEIHFSHEKFAAELTKYLELTLKK